MRVALVHDWLTGLRGGERVLDELARLFPQADLYTLFHVPGSSTERIERLRIRTSPLDRLPGAHRHYRRLLPLFPWAIGRFRLEGYDLVLSTHHAVAKAIPHRREVPHLCYCFTPMRYVWDQADAYLGRGLRRALAWPLVAALRRFDVRTAGPDRVTRFVAISRTVAERIRRRYGREASVLPPPVDTGAIRPAAAPRSDFYLLVGGFVPYKREEIALEAFARLRRRLVVVGDGPRRARLERSAPRWVEFTGRIPDRELHQLYAHCRALVYPQEEDFGLVAVEAQAAGRPVIAFGRGGASETVIGAGPPGPPPERATGVLFQPQSAEALAEAVLRFEAIEDRFDPRFVRAHAECFSPERFRAGLGSELARLGFEFAPAPGSPAEARGPAESAFRPPEAGAQAEAGGLGRG